MPLAGFTATSGRGERHGEPGDEGHAQPCRDERARHVHVVQLVGELGREAGVGAERVEQAR